MGCTPYETDVPWLVLRRPGVPLDIPERSPAEVAGFVVLVSRGECFFSEKARMAQEANASGFLGSGRFSCELLGSAELVIHHH